MSSEPHGVMGEWSGTASHNPQELTDRNPPAQKPKSDAQKAREFLAIRLSNGETVHGALDNILVYAVALQDAEKHLHLCVGIRGMLITAAQGTELQQIFPVLKDSEKKMVSDLSLKLEPFTNVKSSSKI